MTFWHGKLAPEGMFHADEGWWLPLFVKLPDECWYLICEARTDTFERVRPGTRLIVSGRITSTDGERFIEAREVYVQETLL